MYLQKPFKTRIAIHLPSPTIIIEVRPDNIRAIKAYESCGFIKQDLKQHPENKYQPVTLKMGLNKAKYH